MMMSAYTETQRKSKWSVRFEFSRFWNSRQRSDLSIVAYLEALVGLLATSEVLARARARDHGDLVVMAPEELLCSANNVSDDNGGSEREYDVLVVRMQNQSLVHLACKEGVMS